MRAVAAILVGVLGSALAFGCSDAPTGEPDASVDASVSDTFIPPTDSARGESLTPDDPARLVRGPQTYEDLAGKSVAIADGWRDTKRNEVCAPFESTDGRIRCLPLAGTAVWRGDDELIYRFADAECNASRKAVLVPANVKTPPKLLRAPYRADVTQHEMYQIAKSTSREYYVFDHCLRGDRDGGSVLIDSGACGQCVRATAPAGTDVYTTSAEIAPGEFGAFQLY